MQPQSRLSFHLKVLKEAGLVTDRREGRWMYYTLNTESLTEVSEHRNACLGTVGSGAQDGMLLNVLLANAWSYGWDASPAH